jgi:hypothetical protein
LVWVGLGIGYKIGGVDFSVEGSVKRYDFCTIILVNGLEWWRGEVGLDRLVK